jgi:hypothetical protein
LQMSPSFVHCPQQGKIKIRAAKLIESVSRLMAVK